MLRQLVWSFQRSLALTPRACLTHNAHFHLPQRSLFHITNTTKRLAGDEDDGRLALEVDEDYIKPYPAELERINNLNEIVQTLKTRFRLNNTDIQTVMGDDVVHRKHRNQNLLATLDTLAMAGMTKKSFVNYPWLITLDNSRLEKKISLIQSMPIRDINHFAPFLRLSVTRLGRLVSHMNNESEIVPTGNRLYYISDQLKTDPNVIAKYLAKRLFILEMPFGMLTDNLALMIEYQVPPLSILRDLWAFRYAPKSVQCRFERAKRAKKHKIMPWMVRCPEPILQRSLKLTLDEQAVLGDRSVEEYMADRLKFTVEEAKAIMAKHPQVYNVRVTKIKDVLDYILDEAGFTRYDVAQNPRILCHSLETTRTRVDHLKSLGCRPSSLVILCRSKREYEKFVESWIESSRRFRKSQGDAEPAVKES